MNKKKFFSMFVILVIFIASINSTYAISIFDNKTSSSVYKTSEDDSDFSVPFSRIVEDRIEIDKEISQLGVFATSSSIETTKKLEGIQLLYGGDTIRVNSDTEYPIIFSTGNVIINGTIEKSAFIFCNGSIILGENSNVKGNLICYASKLEVNGQIDGNILGEVSTLTVNNNVNGKVKMNLSNVIFSENVVVDKGIEVNTTNKELEIPESVGASKIDIVETNAKLSFKQNVYKVFVAVISNMVIYLLFRIFIKKDRLSLMTKKLNTQGNVIFDGVKVYLVLIAMIVFGIVLLPIITKLGIAMIILSVAVMIVITLLKNAIFALFVSQLVEEKYKESQYKVSSIVSAISTLIIFELLGMIPYVGQMVKFIVFIITIGIIVNLIKRNTIDIKEEKIEPDTIVAK